MSVEVGGKPRADYVMLDEPVQHPVVNIKYAYRRDIAGQESRHFAQHADALRDAIAHDKQGYDVWFCGRELVPSKGFFAWVLRAMVWVLDSAKKRA